MKKARAFIGVVPLGEVSETVSKVVAAHFSGFFNLDAEVLDPLADPVYAFDRIRLQYDAGKILEGLQRLPFSGFKKIVAVFGGDLFVPIFSFVFGEARLGGKCALVSLFRLSRHPDGSPASHITLYERAAKVSMHEFGHLLNLHHCDDDRCLMHFSGGLGDLDKASLYLCKYCSTYLRDGLDDL